MLAGHSLFCVSVASTLIEINTKVLLIFESVYEYERVKEPV